MSDWQPIETAPKDGSLFDGWGFSIPDSGEMPDFPQEFLRFTECYWGKRDSQWVRPKEGWCTLGSDGWSWAIDITHWMPLPAPPSTAPHNSLDRGEETHNIG